MLSLLKRVIALFAALTMPAVLLVVSPAYATSTEVTVRYETNCLDGMIAWVTAGNQPMRVRAQVYKNDRQPEAYDLQWNPGQAVTFDTRMYFSASIAIQTSDSVDPDGQPVWTDWGRRDFVAPVECPMTGPARVVRWKKVKAQHVAVVRTTAWSTWVGAWRCDGKGRKSWPVSSVDKGQYMMPLPSKPGVYCVYYSNADSSGKHTSPVLMGKKTVT